ncbi:MAG: hypothetical protein CR961_01775 [Polaribacter sp.]|nr:MAG: hypothetical protein CR961_01775 [Polaribacter sp.]
MKFSESWTKFQLHFHELSSDKSELIFEDDKVEVYTIPLTHRIYTNGYLFREKPRQRKLNMENVRMYDEIETCDYHNIKAGKDFVLASGEVVPNTDLTIPPPPPKSYAFCSDTIYKPDIVPIIKNVDLLYHEATFLEDRKNLTDRTKHSTAKEAGIIARDANVKQLILGHYSGRYTNLEDFRIEAKTVFENTELAEAGRLKITFRRFLFFKSYVNY